MDVNDGDFYIPSPKIHRNRSTLHLHHTDSRLAISDSCLFSKTSKYYILSNFLITDKWVYCRWKLLKHSLDFIKKSKQLAGKQTIQMKEILTLEMRNEILRTQGEVFDLYLQGLLYRDFANETIKPH